MVQNSIVLCSTVRTVQHDVVLPGTVRYRAVHYSTISTAQRSTILYGTVWCKIVCFSNIMYSMVQFGSVRCGKL